MSKSRYQRYKSVMQKDTDCCMICGSTRMLEWHHIFGAANKKNSEKYGLMVRLCHNCHNEPPHGVHHNAELMRSLRRHGQMVFEELHSREEFMNVFGRNYIETD